MQRKHVTALGIVALILVVALLTSCGTEGPQGPQEPAVSESPQEPVVPQSPQESAVPEATPGSEATPGPPGEATEAVAAVGADYVGSETCGTSGCHEETYGVFMRSGHAYKLNPVVDGKPPDYPFTEVPEPPKGYTWDDVSYVIGGYNWKARFIDQNGFIITGDQEGTTQYNFANEVVGTEPGWVAYHPGEEKPYDCGSCHTTGYNPEGNQDGLEGLIGTWAEPGIRCEQCHGPGSLHAEDPYGVAVVVDRDAELCGQCHLRGSPETVSASGGFIQHRAQYEELFQSKHSTLDCVECHDPHTGVVQLRQRDAQTTRTQCESCHSEQATYQDSMLHPAVATCITCHMPRVTKSAVGDADKFTGDIRTHLMAIDPDQIGQFTEDGSRSLSQLGLDFACRQCHVMGGSATPKTDQELVEKAVGYHAKP